MQPWTGLTSPLSKAPLHPDTPHSLATKGERWPLVENIPYLRTNRPDLVATTLAALDAGHPDQALTLLLADQDDWARTPPPPEQDRRHLVHHAATTSFRAAMDLLAFGPVATYFAHRWSDPTFLSGLALAEAHAAASHGPFFELACGAGHYLREFARTGPTPAGADVVFAKLWLARRYIAPDAQLICFDAAHPWPIPPGRFGTVFCHDAFYFLPNKPHIAAEMRRTAPRTLIGHAHNALTENLSAGTPLDPSAYAALFPGALLYDDRELTAALLEARAPRPQTPAALATAPAIALAANAGTPRPIVSGLALPPNGAPLRRNPLYQNGAIAWPSPRYQAEYSDLATYPNHATGPLTATAGADPTTDTLARRRILLDLPAQW